MCFLDDHRMPITVYMKDEKAGGLISIAEYGQEYGKEDPIRVLYHGFGHYDALLIHECKASISKSKLLQSLASLPGTCMKFT